MKIVDVIFALISGRVVGFVVSDFLREMGINTTFYETLIIWLVFPFLALICLWLASLIGRKILVIFQAAKFFLVGAFATVIDLKFFEFLVWIFSFIFFINPLISKAISFILSTLIKYWGNKYWTFQKHEKDNIKDEALSFFLITIIGLCIDVFTFYCATKVAGPQFGLSIVAWTKLSVIFAALAAALWNFLGYKFLVFKK